MRQFWAWVWIALTSILALVIIIWIVKWVLSKTNIWKDKISFSWKERIKRRQIKKELEEKKETIINPNTEDTYTLEGNRGISSQNFIGTAKEAKEYKGLGSLLKLFESRWGFLLLIVLPVLVTFIYEIYAIIRELIHPTED